MTIEEYLTSFHSKGDYLAGKIGPKDLRKLIWEDKRYGPAFGASNEKIVPLKLFEKLISGDNNDVTKLPLAKFGMADNNVVPILNTTEDRFKFIPIWNVLLESERHFKLPHEIMVDPIKRLSRVLRSALKYSKPIENRRRDGDDAWIFDYFIMSETQTADVQKLLNALRAENIQLPIVSIVTVISEFQQSLLRLKSSRFLKESVPVSDFARYCFLVRHSIYTTYNGSRKDLVMFWRQVWNEWSASTEEQRSKKMIGSSGVYRGWADHDEFKQFMPTSEESESDIDWFANDSYASLYASQHHDSGLELIEECESENVLGGDVNNVETDGRKTTSAESNFMHNEEDHTVGSNSTNGSILDEFDEKSIRFSEWDADRVDHSTPTKNGNPFDSDESEFLLMEQVKLHPELQSSVCQELAIPVSVEMDNNETIVNDLDVIYPQPEEHVHNEITDTVDDFDNNEDKITTEDLEKYNEIPETSTEVKQGLMGSESATDIVEDAINPEINRAESLVDENIDESNNNQEVPTVSDDEIPDADIEDGVIGDMDNKFDENHLGLEASEAEDTSIYIEQHDDETVESIEHIGGDLHKSVGNVEHINIDANDANDANDEMVYDNYEHDEQVTNTLDLEDDNIRQDMVNIRQDMVDIDNTTNMDSIDMTIDEIEPYIPITADNLVEPHAEVAKPNYITGISIDTSGVLLEPFDVEEFKNPGVLTAILDEPSSVPSSAFNSESDNEDLRTPLRPTVTRDESMPERIEMFEKLSGNSMRHKLLSHGMTVESDDYKDSNQDTLKKVLKPVLKRPASSKVMELKEFIEAKPELISLRSVENFEEDSSESVSLKSQVSSVKKGRSISEIFSALLDDNMRDLSLSAEYKNKIVRPQDLYNRIKIDSDKAWEQLSMKTKQKYYGAFLRKYDAILNKPESGMVDVVDILEIVKVCVDFNDVKHKIVQYAIDLVENDEYDADGDADNSSSSIRSLHSGSYASLQNLRKSPYSRVSMSRTPSNGSMNSVRSWSPR